MKQDTSNPAIIKHSGFDPEAGKSPLEKVIQPGKEAATDNSKDNVVTDPEQFAKEIEAKYQEQLKSKEEELKKLSMSLEETTKKFSALDSQVKEEKRKGMSEVDQFKDIITEQQNQIKELLKQQSEQAMAWKEQEWKNTKADLLLDSGLPAKFHKYVHGTTAEEVQSQIADLKSTLTDLQLEIVDKTEPRRTTASVGAAQSTKVRNEGMPAGASAKPVKPSGYRKDLVDKVRQNVTNPMELVELLSSDPDYVDILSGKR